MNVLKTIWGWIEEDRNHKVVIKEDYFAGTVDAPDFSCKDFEIKDGKLTVFATDDREPVVDGATFAPDSIGRLDIAPAYILHDLFYEHLEEMAKEWNWKEKEVRRWADQVLRDAIRQSGDDKPFPRVISDIYFGAVRVFGGIAHKLGKLFLLVLVVLVFAGCASEVFEIGDLPPYEVISK